MVNSFALSFANFPNPTVGVFRWSGFSWTPVLLLSRVFWLGIAFAIAYLSASIFDRFQTACAQQTASPAEAELLLDADAARIKSDVHPTLTRLTPVKSRFRFGAVVLAEIRLMFKGQRWWWYMAAAGLAVASFAVVSREARGMVLAFSWVWPLFLWSSLGVRELRDQTGQLIFSTPHPLARQLPAVWLAGFALTVLTGSGFGLKLLLAGDLSGLRVWTIGALFIPTFALALGVWSRGTKLFEVAYFFLWYLGPVLSIPSLDFMGAVPRTVDTHYPLFYLALTAALALAAVVGRKRELQT